MIKTVVLAVWLAGATQGAAAVESVSDTTGEKAETVASDMPAVSYRAAEPVIEFVKRTRPGVAPVSADRFHHLTEILISAVLTMTAVFSGYMVFQYRKALQGEAVHTKSLPNRTSGAKRTAPKTAETVPKLPSTPRELAQHLKDRRDFHAATVERLFKRL